MERNGAYLFKLLICTILMTCGSDDDSETILKRYDTYMDVTKPVLDFYSKKKNYHEIDGSLEIDNISQKIAQILNV